MSLTNAQQKGLDLIANEARRVERLYGLPREITIAQACLESGYGISAPNNNYFGMKAVPRHKTTQLCETWEEFIDQAALDRWLARDSRRVLISKQPPMPTGRFKARVKDVFAAFPSPTAAFDDYAGLLTSLTGIYGGAWGLYQQKRDLRQLIRDVGMIYATASSYSERLFAVLDKPEVKAAIERAQEVGRIPTT